MDHPDSLREIIDEIRALLPAIQSPRRTVPVSPEVAAWLTQPSARPAAMPAVAPAAAPAAVAPVEAAPPPPVPVTQPVPARAPAPVAAAGGDARQVALAELAAEVAGCVQCGLCKTRKQTVFGVGNPHADVVFVGEAPGAEEDRRGEPFVGPAGQLLTDIIEKGMRVPRDSVYICNVIKCRPPENRDPNAEEVFFCEPFLKQQLAIIRPKVIVALGRVAGQTLLKSTSSTGKLRGVWHRYEGIPLRVTYHPSYLLRQPEEKRKTWDDIQEVMRFMGVGGAAQ
jgi:DNA polymerase